MKAIPNQTAADLRRILQIFIDQMEATKDTKNLNLARLARKAIKKL